MQPGVHFLDSVIERSYTTAETAVPVFVGYTEKVPDADTDIKVYAIASLVQYEEKLGGPAYNRISIGLWIARCALYEAVRHYFESGGGPCFVASVGRYTDLTKATAGGIVSALGSDALFAAISCEPSISLLSIPDLALFADDQVTDLQSVWQAALAACECYPRLFVLLDPPSSFEAAKNCLTWLNQMNKTGFKGAARGAAYWPYLNIRYDTSAGESGRTAESYARTAETPFFSRCIPPSAAVAALIQRTDRERGIWKAPANESLPHVIKPIASHQLGEQLFNENGASINLIRSFPGRGVRVWGCRTLVSDPASPWRYVQVRRLLSYIESNLAELGRFVVFEPNNEITWLKLKGLSRSWLRKLWQKGGLFGSQENQAFRLLLGLGESMTEEDVRAGKLIMHIFVAAQYPAEFIQLQVQLNTSEANAPASSLTNRSTLA